MPTGSQAEWKRFGVFVQRRRKKRGLGLREMSKLATAELRGRGLSAAYLSAIERGLSAPPRPPVLAVMAKLLGVDEQRLRRVAEGFITFDAEQTLSTRPEYAHLLEQVRNGNPTPDGIFPAMNHLLRRSGPERKWYFSLGPSPNGRTELIFFYRP